MAHLSVAQSAAEALLTHREGLSRAITAALYDEMPLLLEKYGERGRGKCLEDMRYNLEHLAPAVALEEPELFARYVTWLRDMLAARNVAADEIRRSLELTVTIARTRLTTLQADAVAAVVETGLRALDG